MKSLIILTLLLVAGSAFAQTTQVTALVADSNGTPYQNCHYSAIFVGENNVSGSGPYLLSGSVFQTSYQGASCDGFGNLSITLPQNSAISPTPSQWEIDFCDQSGKFCSTGGCAVVTISGSTQNVSSALTPCAPILPLASHNVLLQTNGVTNTLQTKENLIAGSGITLTADSLGGTTIAASGGGPVSGSCSTANAIPLFSASTTLACSTFVGNSGAGLTGTATSGAVGSSIALNPQGITFSPTAPGGGGAGVTIKPNNVTGQVGNSISILAGNSNLTNGAGDALLGGGGNAGNQGGTVGTNGGSTNGGDVQISGGASSVSRGGGVQLNGGQASAGRGGDIILEPESGSNAASHGVIYVGGNSTSNDPRYEYFGVVSFSNLAAPAANPFSGQTHGALIHCGDCKGSVEGVVSGTIASGSGNGADLFYDGVNWRVFTGFTTSQPVAIQSTVLKALGAPVNLSDTLLHTITSQAVTMPFAGCPCRADVSYSINFDTTNAGEASAVINDGTTSFATASMNTTGSATDFAVFGRSVSTGTYANSAVVTFTLQAKATNGGTTNAHVANANALGQGTWMQINVMTSN